MSFDVTTLANPHIRELRPYQPGKPIEEVQRELGIADVIKLASNENPLGPSPLAIAAAQEVLGNSHLYPDGGAYQFKQTLAKLLSIDSDQITLGNGSDNVLALIAQAFLNPEQEAVVSEFGFSTFSIITRAMRGIPKVVAAKNYGHDLEAMANAITSKTKLVFVANPNNPTGTYFTHDDLIQLLDCVPQEVLVVVDEAYYEYVQTDDYPDTLALQKIYPNIIITRTFSKLYGLAGLRIGYGISSAAISDYLNRVRLPFNASLPALAAAEAALHDDSHLQRSLACNRSGMQQMQQALADLGLSYIPSAGNFITVDVNTEAQDIELGMLKQGVIVRPLLPYGMPQHLRITIGTEAENQRCLQALTSVLSQGGHI